MECATILSIDKQTIIECEFEESRGVMWCYVVSRGNMWFCHVIRRLRKTCIRPESSDLSTCTVDYFVASLSLSQNKVRGIRDMAFHVSAKGNFTKLSQTKMRQKRAMKKTE